LCHCAQGIPSIGVNVGVNLNGGDGDGVLAARGKMGGAEICSLVRSKYVWIIPNFLAEFPELLSDPKGMHISRRAGMRTHSLPNNATLSRKGFEATKNPNVVAVGAEHSPERRAGDTYDKKGGNDCILVGSPMWLDNEKREIGNLEGLNMSYREPLSMQQQTTYRERKNRALNVFWPTGKSKSREGKSKGPDRL